MSAVAGTGGAEDPGSDHPELLDDRTTTTSQTFQNPDGTLTTEFAPGPVRYRDDAGTWQDIDNTLVHRHGRWVPKSSPLDLEFSDGGAEAFADLERVGDDSVALSWPSTLPEPEVKGATLTYKNALSGGDLVVTALSTGFTHSVVLNERPEPGENVAIPIPVALEGTHLAETTGGGLRITSPQDKPVQAPPPLMWDAAEDATGLPEETHPVDVRVEGASPSEVDADATLILTPDPAVLSDPGTEYPVTIDPTYTISTPWYDVFVNNGSYTDALTTNAWDTFRTGTQNSGTNVTRSFLKFPAINQATLDSWDIQSATVQARVVGSPSCTNGTTIAYPITEDWTVGGSNAALKLTWANQPSVDTSYVNSPQQYVPYGGPSGSSCTAHGWYGWNVTPGVKDWRTGGDHAGKQFGFRLQAATETANGSFREYRSRDGSPSDSTYHPKLVITYNSYPNTPTGLSMTPYLNGYAGSTTPTLSATVIDPDGGAVHAKFDVYSGANVVWSGSGSSVTSGGTSTAQVPAGTLVNGSAYTLRAYASDGSLVSGQNSTSSGYVPVPFTVDTTALGDGGWLEPEASGPLATSYGVDTYELEDLQALAADEGVSVQEAVDKYGWAGDLADAAQVIATDDPLSFAFAELSDDAPGATIHFKGSVPASANEAVAGLSGPVELLADAPYTEAEQQQIIDTVTDSLDSQLTANGNAFTVELDPHTGDVSAAISTGEVGPSLNSNGAHESVSRVDAETPSSTELEDTAEAAVTQELPSITTPAVIVTFIDAPGGATNTLRGGVVLAEEDYEANKLYRCTSGFPAKEDGSDHGGLLSARHCKNDMMWYAYGQSGQRAVLDTASLFLDKDHGDIQYQRSLGESVGKSFYYLPGKTRAILGVKKPYVGMPICMFGRSSKGYRDGKRTCTKIKNLNQSGRMYVDGEKWIVKGMGETHGQWSIPGDSGGPWFSGGYAVGIVSGNMPCGFLWKSTCDTFTPLQGNEGRGSFDVHVWY
ncbi:MAG: DNRLRE domain-containing protein [Nocardioidaceae bacterium]|nr:DNRLRE domain-containing protein [Nocardioidaceae bacterium]